MVTAARRTAVIGLAVLVAVGGAIAVGLALVGGEATDRGERPTVSIDALLAPAAFPGNAWPEEDWEHYETVVPTPSTTESKARTWWTVDRRDGLVEDVLRFNDVAGARRYFRQADPKSYDEDYPLRADETGRYRSTSADEFRVYCLGQTGSSEACGLWTYWARYGQYVLRFDYVAGLVFDDPDTDTGVLMPGIDVDKFLGYVRPFDDLMTDTLGPSSASRGRG